jgi:hypothetical protein
MGDSQMLGVILGLVGALVIGASAISVAFVLGMRTKSRFVQGPIIWIGKHGFNRKVLKTAGTAGASAAVIRHRGRASGRVYETPIAAIAAEGGFLIALPYGLRSNWLRNVLAAGTATLTLDGQTYDVDEPELIPLSSVATAFAPREQRMHQIFNVTQVLRLHRVEQADAGVAAALGLAA